APSFSFLLPPAPTSPLFPYTTLFRSGRTYLREETFTLGTRLFGLLTIWQVLWIAGFALFFYVFRRGLRKVVAQVVGEPRRVSLASAALVIAVLVSVAVASQAIYVETDLDATEYKVADLWQLFEGLMFIVRSEEHTS